MMQDAASKPSTKSAIGVLVSWLNCWQSNSAEVKHFNDGLHGCGTEFEQKISTVYFEIMQNVGDSLAQTNDSALARSLLNGFKTKFRAAEF